MKLKTAKIFALVPLLLYGLGTTAQTLSDYTLRLDTVQFQTIIGTPGAHTLSAVTGDNNYDFFSMPFAFPFGEGMVAEGERLNVSSNGYIFFGTMTQNTPGDNANYAYNSQYNFRMIVPCILADGYCNRSAGEGAFYADTVDENGDRVLIVEMRGMAPYYGRNTCDMNYQVHLYEDGHLSVVFDSSVFNHTSVCNIVLSAGSTDHICLEGFWETPRIGTPSSLPTMVYAPAAGSRYTFAPPENFCRKPVDLYLNSTSSTQTTLHWSSPADSFTVYIGSATEWTDSITLQDTSYTFANLEPATEYLFGVSARCSTSRSAISTITGRTNCSPVTTLPFSEDFEAYSSTADWGQCWTRYYKSSSGTISIGYDNYTSNIIIGSRSGSRNMRLQVTPQTSTGVDRQWCLVGLPQIDAPLSDLTLAFDASFQRVGQQLLIVGVLEEPTDTGSFVAVDTLSILTDEWEQYIVDFSTYTGEGQTIAFFYCTTESYGYSTYYAYVDNIVVLPTPGCAAPQGLTVDSLTVSSALLNIADSIDGGTYTLRYWVEEGDTTETTLSSTRFLLENLDPSTAYGLSVSRRCDDGSLTFPISAYFRTPCETLTHDDLPYQEDFNSYQSYIGAPIDPCWTILNYNTANNYPYPSGMSNHSGLNGKSLYFYPSGDNGQYLSLPPMDDISDVRLSFFTSCSNQRARIEVGVMQNPLDSSTFVPLYTVEPQGTSWEQHEVDFDSYHGEGRHIAFHSYATMSTSYAISIDDVLLDVIPVCQRPVSLSIDQPTLHSLRLSIHDTANAGAYRIEYSHDSISSTVSTEDTVYILSGLDAGTEYSISVASICWGDELSEAVSAQGTTLCATLDSTAFPWSEDFEEWATGVGSGVPVCWTASYGNDTLSLDAYAKVYAILDGESGNHKGVRMYGERTYSTGDTYSTLLLPKMEADFGRVQMEVKMRFAVPYSREADYMEFGLMQGEGDSATFVACARVENPGDYHYHTYTLRLSAATADSGRVGMRYHFDQQNDFSYCVVDSIGLSLVEEADTLCVVQGLRVDTVGETEATVSWSSSCGADLYEVRLASGYADAETLLFTTTDTLFSFSNLEAARLYNVRVRIATDSLSAAALWSDSVQFRTLDEETHVSVERSATESALQVYPNPATDRLTLCLPEEALVQLLDATGRTLLRTKASEGKLTVDVSQFAAGTYFVRAVGQRYTHTASILVR